MDFDTQGNRSAFIMSFPQLGTDGNFSVNSAETAVYNCIAWAMNVTNCWVDHNRIAGHWWPDGVERNLTPNALVHAFEAVGFELTDDYAPEFGFDKVILYKSGSCWTHASRIVSKGVEHSKFGSLWDAIHSSNVFHGTVYGDAYACMKRAKSDNHLTADAITESAGRAQANLQRLIALLKKP